MSLINITRNVTIKAEFTELKEGGNYIICLPEVDEDTLDKFSRYMNDRLGDKIKVILFANNKIKIERIT